MKLFEHYILTLFNIDRGFDKANKRNNPDYLERRLNLFELITIPSILSQKNKNFYWLVFFDLNTPTPFKARLEKLSKLMNFSLVYTKNSEDVLAILRERISPISSRYLITTNLDNDDAISNDFVEMIHQRFRDNREIYFLNFPLGYMLRRDGLFMREFLSSPFHTLVEPVNEQVLTCLSVSHDRLYSLSLRGVPVYQIPAKPAWLQLVHETNVINRRDVNAIPVSRIQEKLNSFGINAVPPYFEEVSNLRSGRWVYSRKLIEDKKKTSKHKTKLVVFTWLPFMAPVWLMLRFIFQQVNEHRYHHSVSDIRKILLNVSTEIEPDEKRPGELDTGREYLKS